MPLPRPITGRAAALVPAVTGSSAFAASSRSPAWRADWVKSFDTLIAAAILAGFLLRFACFRSDLGLDEAWSLRLVSRVRALGEVFWGISHDNNHFLNSAWLFLVGQDQPAWLYRLPALVFGTLTVPAMARWLVRSSRPAAVWAAWLSALALPLVDFGSEARGYAGLALATVLALDHAEQAVAHVCGPTPDRFRAARQSWALAGAVCFGALCHLGMVMTLAVIGAAATLSLWRQTRSLSKTVLAASSILWPSCVALLPAAVAVAAGIVNTGRWAIGDVDPFTPAKLLDGFGSMMLMSTGLPDALPSILGVVGAGLLVAGTARTGLLTRPKLDLALAALVVMPGAIALARLPNVGYARYYAVCGIVLLAIEAETLGTAWLRGGQWRRRAASLGVALLVCALMIDGLQIWTGRGGFSATLRIMSIEGTPTYTTDRPAMAELLLRRSASGAGQSPVLVPPERFCADKPAWYIGVGTYDPQPKAAVTIGPPECATTYRVRAPFMASPLSGTPWTLYRRS